MRYGIGSLRDNQQTRSCFIWISNGIPDLENTNSVKISKIHKTESSVPFEPEVDLDFRGHSNMVAQ